MAYGQILPVRLDALYQVEVTYGYDKPIPTRRYQYLVDGQRLTYRQICEALPEVCPQLISTRLHGNGGYYQYTMEQLSRPVGTVSEQGLARLSKAGQKSALQKQRRRLAAIEHRKAVRNLAKSHQQVQGRLGKRAYTDNGFKPCVDIVRLQQICASSIGAELLELSIDTATSQPAFSALVRAILAVFQSTITYSGVLEKPESVKTKGDRHRLEFTPAPSRHAHFNRILKQIEKLPVKEQELTIPVLETHMVTIRLVNGGTQNGHYYFDFDIHHY